MSVIYVGDGVATLHLQPGSAWSRTEEGLDVLDEVYAGPVPAKAAWLRGRPRGVTHSIYRSMHLVSNFDEDGRSYSTVQLQWVGLRNEGPLPVPILSRRSATKSTSNSSTVNIPGSDPLQTQIANRDVSYIAPEIVWTYATDNEILTAQQTPFGVISQVSETILRDVITTEDGKRYSGSAPAGLVSALGMVARWRLIGLDSLQIRYTPYWANQEVWAFEYPPG